MLPWWPMRRRALLSALALAVLAIVPAACLSPTLPLPPPEISTITQASVAGTWEVSGDCTAGAIVTVLDRKTHLGAVYEDTARTGFFSVTIDGAVCDDVQVFEDVDGELSSDVSYALQAMADGEPVSPMLCQ